MSARSLRQQAVADELHAIAIRLDRINGELLEKSLFPARHAFTEGQVNSCLIVAYQNLDAVIDTIVNGGEESVIDPRGKAQGPYDDPVFPVMERCRKPRGKRGLETAPAATAGVVRAGKRAVAGLVAGGAQ